MTPKEIALKIAEYVARNSWKESRFSTPNPQREMNADGLLEFLVDDLKIVTGDELNAHLETLGL